MSGGPMNLPPDRSVALGTVDQIKSPTPARLAAGDFFCLSEAEAGEDEVRTVGHCLALKNLERHVVLNL
jgi:hypothetical protein